MNIVGKKATFRYPDYGTPDSHPDYTAHSGQVVEIERQLSPEEVDAECGPMFRIRAKDGWTGDVNRDELTVHRGQKARPKPVRLKECCDETEKRFCIRCSRVSDKELIRIYEKLVDENDTEHGGERTWWRIERERCLAGLALLDRGYTRRRTETWVKVKA
jgi:hypothetical protein